MTDRVYDREVVFELKSQQLIVNSDRALFWKNENTLILSDLHLGKAGHFRKNGIPIPRRIHLSDLQRINSLIDRYAPRRILFLGDLFHSEENDEWNDLVFWSGHHGGVEQILVQGNHDILPASLYGETAIRVVTRLDEGPFVFSHEALACEGYNISGHVHPGVRLYGAARQGVVLSCFYFGKEYAVLPAFGLFTGSHPVRTKKGDRIFAIADNSLIGLVG